MTEELKIRYEEQLKTLARKKKESFLTATEEYQLIFCLAALNVLLEEVEPEEEDSATVSS